MYRVRVFVTLKESILDPAGNAVQGSLQNLGFDEVREVRVGKVIELNLESVENVEARVKEMCEAVLVNMVMEAYRFEIEEILT